MGTIGNSIALGVALCAVLFAMLIPSLVMSIPGWIAGQISARNSPQLRSLRRPKTYWAAWVLLGTLPLAVSVAAGPFAGAGQIVSGPWAIGLAVLAMLGLNISAFHIGYSQSLATKAKRDIRNALRDPANAMVTDRGSVDWYDENHPAVTPAGTSGPVVTRPLPVIHPTDHEYPTARPSGE